MLGLGQFFEKLWLQTKLQTGNEYVATVSLPSAITEQTIFDFNTQFVALSGRRIKNISAFVDVTNLTQDCTFRFNIAIDGNNLRAIDQLDWVTAMNAGVYFDLASCNINFSITAQSKIVEGAARDIPVRVVFEQMEQ